MGLSGEIPLGEAKTKAPNSDYHKNEPPAVARQEEVAWDCLKRAARIGELNGNSLGPDGPIAAVVKRHSGVRVLVFVVGASGSRSPASSPLSTNHSGLNIAPAPGKFVGAFGKSNTKILGSGGWRHVGKPKHQSSFVNAISAWCHRALIPHRGCASGTTRACKGMFSAHTQVLRDLDLPEEDIRVLSKNNPRLPLRPAGAGRGFEVMEQMGLSGETPLGEAKTKAPDSDYHKDELPVAARQAEVARDCDTFGKTVPTQP